MKLSVSLPPEDVDFVDAYAQSRGMASRSAVVRRALMALRSAELGPAYADAWNEWQAEGHVEAWEAAVGDGLGE